MTEKRAQRRLAAILIADAVGFSRLMGRDETGALALLKERRNLIGRAVASHQGRVFGGAGDSAVAEFPSAVEAVAAAIDMQAAIAKLNGGKPAGQGMEFRVGINLGDVMAEGRNLFGDGVNVAERLQALAAPGGVCVSASVHEQVRDKLAISFLDLGEKPLKNIARPVHVFAVAGAATHAPAPKTYRKATRMVVAAAAAIAFIVATWFIMPFPGGVGTPNSGPPAVAVLPFQNLSGDPAEDYFSEGVAGDINVALGRFSEISVIAPHAAQQFRDENADPDAVQKQLGADFLVEGSVRKSGNRVRVSVSLTDTASKHQLWSQQYDRELGDIFAVQDEIVQNVAGLLITEVSKVERERVLQKPPDDLAAYDLLLRGRAAMATRTRADNIVARDFFQKAIEKEPGFAAALTALGLTYLFEANAGWTEFSGESLDKAQQLAQQALVIEPRLAEAHQLLAEVHLARVDYDRARVEVSEAISLNPSFAYSYATQSWILMWLGDTKGSIHAIETAVKLDPFLDFDYRYSLGTSYYLEGRYDEAIAALEPLAGKNLDYLPYAILAAAYAELGRDADAGRAVAELKRLWPFFTISNIDGAWRDRRSAERVIEGLLKAGLQ